MEEDSDIFEECSGEDSLLEGYSSWYKQVPSWQTASTGTGIGTACDVENLVPYDEEEDDFLDERPSVAAANFGKALVKDSQKPNSVWHSRIAALIEPWHGKCLILQYSFDEKEQKELKGKISESVRKYCDVDNSTITACDALGTLGESNVSFSNISGRFSVCVQVENASPAIVRQALGVQYANDSLNGTIISTDESDYDAGYQRRRARWVPIFIGVVIGFLGLGLLGLLGWALRKSSCRRSVGWLVRCFSSDTDQIHAEYMNVIINEAFDATSVSSNTTSSDLSYVTV